MADAFCVLCGRWYKWPSEHVCDRSRGASAQAVPTTFDEVVQQLRDCRDGRCAHQNRPDDCIAFDETCSVHHRIALGRLDIEIPYDVDWDVEAFG